MKRDVRSKYPLRALFWEATLRCNAQCEFCGSRCGENNQRELKKAEITNDEICACFKEVAERYNPEEIMIDVTGGEPFLRADIFDVMSYASALGFSWGMATNGSLITEEIDEAVQYAHYLYKPRRLAANS